ncbi:MULTISPECIES: hypothetical protein [unclassified Streptomyces]|uniref:hypothetical protein n=1 Tax=unclassified Streptomyces TaxID=2593676 RepID=UPI0003A5DF82|nr:hypothetical protein [Streptomyces sp. LaPpAH-202]MYW60051.1 hypothetical protein [Streptomyces sp. SID8370]MYW87969.1 hypothetical protein [Streptomyces sp. SID8371]
MLLSDLAKLCGMQDSWVGLISESKGVREERKAKENYVIPEMRIEHVSDPVTPSLILITAPAAVGKTTAAHYLSHTLRAPIVDLSTLHVGSNALEGALWKSMSPRKAGNFVEEMKGGRATLIVDALDEAEIRSGQANFQAFLRDVAETASDMSGNPAMIMLSRAESVRSLTGLFKERNLQYSHFEILPFGRAQAETYLDSRMVEVYAASGKEAMHRRYVAPYEKARDTLFSLLASVISSGTSDIWEDPSVRDFLGYAPVLDVAAEFLAVDNFTTLHRDFSSSEAVEGTAHWHLVAQVIDHLLVREQDKFVTQFVETAEFESYGDRRLSAALYAPEEQCTRLLDYVENIPTSVELPALLPERLREPYEVAVTAQLVNHPFLRGSRWFNVIFRDYVTARSLASVTTAGDAGASIRSRLLSSEWKHSPMFAYFTHALTQVKGVSVSTCHSELFGALYESFKSMCVAGDTLHFTAGRHGNRLVASYAVSSKRQHETVLAMGPLTFASYEGNLTLTFPRELSNAEIYEVPEVMLGGEGSSFKFGPSVYIACHDLLVVAKDIQVFGTGDESEMSVLLNVANLISENVKIRVESAQLHLLCDDLSYPWTQYQKKLNPSKLRSDAREASALYLELRRIVLRFKDAKKGEAALFQPFVDNLIIGENRRARTALDFLQSIGCVELRNSMYLLDLAEFAKLGISRPQLRELEMSEAVVAVHQRLVEFASRKGR